ncbi:hypothetical protein CLAIMM_05188 [Cladophialophora immunda]|nr:hypothetical protein CLAIMM_05188 [Cladophialophora immunda]
MSKPSILLVPGSFVLPEYYDPVFDAVRAKGYDIKGLHIPSVGLRTLEGRPGKPPTMYDDADFIAKEVKALADEGKDVILIAHSYSGIPVSQCTKGLGKEERRKQGEPGGLVNLAYLTCLVPALGANARSILAEAPDEHKVDMKVHEDGWMEHYRPESTAAICFSSLPLEEGTAWVKKFPKHSAVSFENPLTYADYKDIPCSYLLCEQDLCIPASVQRAGIDLIEKESGRKVDVTRIQADHVPNWTYKQATIDWIVGLGEKCASK